MTESEIAGVLRVHGERIAIVETKVNGLDSKIDQVLSRIPEKKDSTRIEADHAKPWYAYVLPFFSPLVKAGANALMIVTVGFFLVMLAVKQPSVAEKVLDIMPKLQQPAPPSSPLP